jgi:hypothetical protein
MRELLIRGKKTIDPEVIDPGGRSVEDSPVKRYFTFFTPGKELPPWMFCRREKSLASTRI